MSIFKKKAITIILFCLFCLTTTFFVSCEKGIEISNMSNNESTVAQSKSSESSLEDSCNSETSTQSTTSQEHSDTASVTDTSSTISTIADGSLEIFERFEDEYGYLGVKDKQGNIVIPAKYTDIWELGSNRILAGHGSCSAGNNFYDLYDYKGNIICDKFNFVSFYTDNNNKKGKYGIGAIFLDDVSILNSEDRYIINQDGKMLYKLDCLDYGFENENTFWVIDTPDSEKRYIYIPDLDK